MTPATSQALNLDAAISAKRKFRSYGSFKACPIPFVPRVPSHWRVEKLKHVASVRFSSVDKKSEEDEAIVRLCNYTDVYNRDVILDDPDFMQATATVSEIKKFTLCKGDVLITKDSEEWNDIAVPAYVAQDLPGVLCGYHLALIRPNPTEIDGAFLSRAFAADGIRQQFHVAANGITRYGLPNHAIASALFPVPPLDEQRAIAAFLDRETAKIDALIDMKQRMITLLQEEQHSLICHVVTGEHSQSQSGTWSNLPIGKAIKLQRGFDITGAAHGEGKYPVISSGGLTGYCERPMVKGPGVIVGRKGTLGTVHYSDADYWPHDTTLWVKEFRGNNRRFVYYVLIQMNLKRFDVGAANPTVNRNHVHPTIIRWPDLETQRRIVAYLDLRMRQFDQLIERISVAIPKLIQLRAALISAAVAGHIEVRQNGKEAT